MRDISDIDVYNCHCSAKILQRSVTVIVAIVTAKRERKRSRRPTGGTVGGARETDNAARLNPQRQRKNVEQGPAGAVISSCQRVTV